MNVSMVQEAMYYFGLFALASVFGALSYAAIMLAKDGMQDFFLVSGFFLVALPSALAYIVTIPAVIVIGLLCILPASLERRFDQNRSEWYEYFVRIIAATYLSFMVGMGTVLLSSLSQNFRGWEPLAALCAGFVLTPPSISLLRWIFHTSKLRPGHDRPLDQDEKRPDSTSE
ncbi:hypothetical protein IAD21_00660 [Abditibacteriota bacterium]|nr:hypothetical protein IAD21_00660 [Abditibacteriota bacterium]